MLLVRTGGIFGVIVSLIVAGIFFFVVRPAINDTTDRAFDTADRAFDEASRQADDIRSTIAAVDDRHQAATTSPPRRSARSCAEIKEQVGADGELLGLTASEHGGGNVKYRTGDRAAGFQWGPGLRRPPARQGHADRLGQARRQRLPDRQARPRRDREADRRGAGEGRRRLRRRRR